MFAPRYFPVRYFALRYWPNAGAAVVGDPRIVTTALEGGEITIYTADILAVEEGLTRLRDTTYTGVRSTVYTRGQKLVVRATAASIIVLIQAAEAWASTITETSLSGRQIDIRAVNVESVEERQTLPADQVWNGVRSRITVADHVIVLRSTAASVVLAVNVA